MFGIITKRVTIRNKISRKIIDKIRMNKEKVLHKDEIIEEMKIYESYINQQLPNRALQFIEDKYGLQYRFVPAKGYILGQGLHGEMKYVKKRIGDLDQRVIEDMIVNPRKRRIAAAIIGLSLIISFLFLSSNITGNTIANLSQNTSNFIGTILFLASLIASFILVRKR